MKTVGDLCNTLGISIGQLDRETAPEMKICRHFEVCSFGHCEHRWPHHPAGELGTCDEEVCSQMGVVAGCINVSEASVHQYKPH